MTTFGVSSGDHVPLCEELARIVLRAESLGFSRHRVANALRIAFDDLPAVEDRQRFGSPASADRRFPHPASQ